MERNQNNTEHKPEEKRKKKQLDHTEFFRVCRALEKMKNEVLDKRPTLAEAANILSEATKLHVARSTVINVQAATGITWQPKITRTNTGKERLDNSVRILTRALHRLYTELGQKPTMGLERLYSLLNDSKGISLTDEQKEEMEQEE